MNNYVIEIQEELRGKNYIFHTKPGIFSKSRIDPGSRLLIETMEIRPTDLILDLGCGYGPIGIVAASLAYQGRVFLIDSNIRAVRLAEENIKLNSLTNTTALLSDGFEAVSNHQFSVILCNPPSSSGIEIFEEFCQDSLRHLKLGGKLYFVTQSRLKNAVKGIFERILGNFKIASRNAKYTVSLAIKS